MNKTSRLRNLKEALVLIEELEGKRELQNEMVKIIFRKIAEKLTLARGGGMEIELTMGYFEKVNYEEKRLSPQ